MIGAQEMILLMKITNINTMLQLNLELFLAQKVKEMDQFYSQINHDSKSQIKLQHLNALISDQVQKDLFISQSYSKDEELKEERYRQNSESRMQNEFIDYETKTSQFNAFDELPIKQTSKTFEELIAEQGIVVDDSVPPKKQFLKKGTRQFLSNAQVRSEIQKKEHEEMLRMNNENAEITNSLKKKPINFLQKGKGKQCMGKLHESIENSKLEEVETKVLSQSQSEYQSRPSFEGSCGKSQTEEVKQSQFISFQSKSNQNFSTEGFQIKKLKQQLEQQSREFQRQKEEWNKKLEFEKNEFEKWKEDEKKKLEKLRQSYMKQSVNNSTQRVQVTKRQLEELDHLRKVVIQLSEEIKFLRSVKQENKGSYALIHSAKGEAEKKGELEELVEVDEDDDDQREVWKEREMLDLTSLWPKNRIEIQMINQVIDEQKFEYQNNKFYNEYINQPTNLKIIHQTTTQDGKVQKIYSNQKKEIIFQNGVKREVFPNGYIIVHFTNKDVKQTFPDGTIVYYFSEAKTTQVTFPQGGPNIYRFNNRQIEIHFGDNSKQIRFADGTQKFIHQDQSEETLFSDGIFQRTDANKIKYIEYPNGSMDILYPDGRKERRSPIK